MSSSNVYRLAFGGHLRSRIRVAIFSILGAMISIIPGGMLFNFFWAGKLFHKGMAPIAQWRLLPVSEAEIGRALWFENLGFPLFLSVIGALIAGVFLFHWEWLVPLYGLPAVVIFNIGGLGTLLRAWPLRCGASADALWASGVEKYFPWTLGWFEFVCILMGGLHKDADGVVNYNYRAYSIENIYTILLGLGVFFVSAAALYKFPYVPSWYWHRLNRRRENHLRRQKMARRMWLNLTTIGKIEGWWGGGVFSRSGAAPLR